MITEDYVSFETAKLLKEKGFDEKCNHYWQYDKANDKDDVDVDGICLQYCDGLFELNNELNNHELDTLFEESLLNFGYSAPTLQMAMKWLREVHNVDISVTPDRKAGYSVLIFKDKRLPFDTLDSYFTYEQACEAAIKYCLENLI